MLKHSFIDKSGVIIRYRSNTCAVLTFEVELAEDTLHASLEALNHSLQVLVALIVLVCHRVRRLQLKLEISQNLLVLYAKNKCMDREVE